MLCTNSANLPVENEINTKFIDGLIVKKQYYLKVMPADFLIFIWKLKGNAKRIDKDLTGCHP